MGGGLALLFWAGEPLIPGVFSSDPDVTAAVREVLPLAVAMLPVNAAVYVFDGVLVGASDFRFLAGGPALLGARECEAVRHWGVGRGGVM